MIVFRLVHGLRAQTVSALPQDHQLKIDDRVASDFFNLNADYPDPFLAGTDSVIKDTLAKVDHPQIRQPDNVTPPTASPAQPITSFIQYNGMISNPQGKVSIAIVTIHGKEYILKEGERTEGVIIKKIKKDKVTILYKEKLYSIRQ